MTHTHTAWKCLALAAVTAVAALPLCASSPRRAQSSFDAADRLVSAQVVSGTNVFAETCRYDACGALTNKQSGLGDQQYGYDCAGRLAFASVPGASLAVTYDALGNRVTAGNRLWITDHADPLKRPLLEACMNGGPIRHYVWGGGLLLAVVEADGAVRYAHSDEQGSVIALTDASGAATDQYCYGPYGADWGRTGTNSIPFRWLGSHGVLAVSSFIPHPSSFSSSLYLTRHRAYDAALGRFLSADPLGLGGGPNLYAYCLGNPLAYIDPLGLALSAAGIGEYRTSISADRRSSNSYCAYDNIYDLASDPRTRALMHVDALLPSGALGTSFGDSMAASMAVNTFTAPGFAVLAETAGSWMGRLFGNGAAESEILGPSGPGQFVLRSGQGSLERAGVLRAGGNVNRVFDSRWQLGAPYSQPMGGSFSPGSALPTSASQAIIDRGLNWPGIVNNAGMGVVFRSGQNLPITLRTSLGGSSPELLIAPIYRNALQQVTGFLPIAP